jgi:ubiquinol-cytochrome c reductase cytochrome b subunit
MTPSSSGPDPDVAPVPRAEGWWDRRLAFPAIRRYLDTFSVPGHGSWAHALGGALVTLLAFEAVTGLLLLVYFEPDAAGAHRSVTAIAETVRFGWLVRSLHHWGAHAAVVVMLLHGASTFLRRAFRAPREVTWWIGLSLGLAVMGLAFSGTVLPWDGPALYAAQVGGAVLQSVPWVGLALADVARGGPAVGPATLHRAYVTHAFVLPAFLLLASAAHIFLVHAHGLAPTLATTGRTSWRSFLPRAALGWLLLINVIVVIAALRPPLVQPAVDVMASDSLSRPPWFLMAVFQLARRAPAWACVATLAAAVSTLVAAPAWGRLRYGKRVTFAVGFTFALGLLALTALGYRG